MERVGKRRRSGAHAGGEAGAIAEGGRLHMARARLKNHFCLKGG